MEMTTQKEIDNIVKWHCAGKPHYWIMREFKVSWLELKEIIFENKGGNGELDCPEPPYKEKKHDN
mgnify:CR=1 FL=1